MTRVMTSKEYVESWELNAKQHLEDGDYEWVCDQIKPYHGVLEIGCGVGYSTEILLAREHQVLSVDSNEHAIQRTKEQLNDWEAQIATTMISFDQSDAWLWNLDTVRYRDMVIEVVRELPINLVLLCNPGGNLDPKLRKYEAELLQQYGFTSDEIDDRYNQGAFPLLHKFSMIYAAADIAINANLPLMIVERGSKQECDDFLRQTTLDTKMRCVFHEFRRIRPEPEDGIILGSVDGQSKDGLYWCAGMFFKD